MVGNNFLCKYFMKQLNSPHRVCRHSFPEIHEVNLRTLTEMHIIAFRKQLINLLFQPAWAIVVRLVEMNIIPLIIFNKTHSFITGKIFSYTIYKYMIKIRISRYKMIKGQPKVHFIATAGRFYLKKNGKRSEKNINLVDIRNNIRTTYNIIWYIWWLA